jgi:hypothetical protein
VHREGDIEAAETWLRDHCRDPHAGQAADGCEASIRPRSRSQIARDREFPVGDILWWLGAIAVVVVMLGYLGFR